MYNRLTVLRRWAPLVEYEQSEDFIDLMEVSTLQRVGTTEKLIPLELAWNGRGREPRACSCPIWTAAAGFKMVYPTEVPRAIAFFNLPLKGGLHLAKLIAFFLVGQN